MKPHHVIGFKASSRDHGYDCSFSVMFPQDAQVTQDEVERVCNRARIDANALHKGIVIHGRVERTIMAKV